MRIFGWLKAFSDRYGPLVGLLGLIVGTILGLYPIIHVNKPGITVEIVSEANIVDVYKPLKDLTVSFQGQDIQSANLNLRIFSLRVSSTGDVDILSSHYDS